MTSFGLVPDFLKTVKNKTTKVNKITLDCHTLTAITITFYWIKAGFYLNAIFRHLTLLET